MDLLTIALAKKYAGSGGSSSIDIDGLVPYIGENGNWYIKGEDSGISALPNNNVEVDGVLKVDSENGCIYVEKDGEQTLVGEATHIISDDKISALFVEEG